MFAKYLTHPSDTLHLQKIFDTSCRVFKLFKKRKLELKISEAGTQNYGSWNPKLRKLEPKTTEAETHLL